MELIRKKTKSVLIGNVAIGNNEKIAIQSMTNTKTENVEATLQQILMLKQSGCDIVRASVYSMECAQALKKIKEKISIPLVADVHFDHKIAIAAIENGADKLRINPGNISKPEYISELTDCAKAHRIPIRIGVNLGSLNKTIEEKYGRGSDALVASAMENIKMLEDRGFYDIVVSVKASDVKVMVDSYTKLSRQCDYPLHLGVTEAGDKLAGTVKSAVGIGTLLLNGIGDTIRVSLTGDPLNEVLAAKEILRSIGLYSQGVEIISCPTCGRTRVPLEEMVNEVRNKTQNINSHIKVAVMGCVVNGPGEARDADVGIACGDGKGVIFRNGTQLGTYNQEELIPALLKEISVIDAK